MKKIIMCVIVLVCFSYGICMAIPQSEIALGGVTYGMKFEDVKKIYGKPTEKHRDRFKTNTKMGYDWIDEYTYGKGFEIHCDSSGKVISVITKANNGIATPAGFTCGGNANEVLEYFGEPFNSISGVDNKTGYTYNGDSFASLTFVVKDDKIISIYLSGTQKKR